jgi:hypothetical protein
LFIVFIGFLLKLFLKFLLKFFLKQKLNRCQYNKIRLLKISIQSMNAHRIETALTENGKLSLVEIIILDRSSSKTTTDSYPLRGTVIRYDDPFEPATSAEDWEALQ